MRTAFAACFWILPLAAVADEGAIADGAALFAELCVDCHGPTGTDGEAGDIRGLPASTVSNATQGFEMMPSFDLEADEIKAIAAWLASL
jgi:mono/diheme cytochrome c family protein